MNPWCASRAAIAAIYPRILETVRYTCRANRAVLQLQLRGDLHEDTRTHIGALGRFESHVCQ